VIGLLRARLLMGRQTIAYPDGPARLPERYRGRPVVHPDRCAAGCHACSDACPAEAIVGVPAAVDMGACLFCGRCEEACPTGAVTFTRDFRLAANDRDALVVRDDVPRLAAALDAKMRRLFGRSLKLRQVSAGGCNGCEAELNASGNVQFDLSRFGIQFVASPRHADGVVVTGPVTDAMRSALLATWEATPAPRLLIAVGACAISGGPVAGGSVCPGAVQGAFPDVPVDLWIPGCPPHPLTILDGLLRLLGRVEGDRLELAPTGILR
jgi:Ni,Fe-hydrogenase III small subunit/formate hydrogenlyase subunit 6/NADH:ubiquinone oxidoreductase subunit I